MLETKTEHPFVIKAKDNTFATSSDSITTSMDTQKYAVIVGATSGIGLQVTRILSQRGWKIGIAGRRKEKLEEIKNEVGGVIATAQIDITHPQAASQLLSLIHSMNHPIHLYFHSSGIGYQNPSLEEQLELDTVETNALGFTRMIDTVFHYFENECKGYGHIAAISSIAGTKGLGAAPAYSATKRFQNTYLEALSQLSHIRSLHIRITDIRPGFVSTALLKDEKYPLVMSVPAVAREIVRAIERKSPVKTIDWRYRILVFFWRLIPRCIWTRLRIITKQHN